MESGVAQEHIRTALRAELNRHYGRIGEIEQGLGRAEGYLGKFCRGEISIPMDSLLKSIELLGADPGQFFCQALGTPVESSAHLRDIMAPEPEKSLARLQKAAAEIAMDTEAVDVSDLSGVIELPVQEEPDPDVLKLVDAVMECTWIEQRRRIRSAKRYRSTAFVRAYLHRLVAKSYGDPKSAAKQAEVVGAELVPQLQTTAQLVRLELVLRSMSVWAFARRLTTTFEQSAAAVHFALSLSMSFRLDPLTAELLRNGAYVLTDNSRYSQALKLLGEAMVIYDELDQSKEVAKVLVQRGNCYLESGDALSAARALRKALRRMQEDDASLQIYRLAAFQGLSRAYEFAGDLASAEEWLGRAVGCLGERSNINRAKLLWNVGRLARLRGDLLLAEEQLREAQNILVGCDAGESILVSLDLTRVLLELNKPLEAVELARGMASLIGSVEENPIFQAALVEFVRSAIEGQLTLALIDRLKKTTQGRREQAGHK